ncbi:MAG: hypothetical protein JNM17_12795 [Archangium sp.]|nr:hypothetical protein [Archangium sp.]
MKRSLVLPRLAPGRAFLLLSLLALSACPPPTEEQCAGPAGDDAGVIISPIPGFPAVGQPLRRLVTGPVTTCRTSVEASVEVIAPGNVRGTGVVESVSFMPVPLTATPRSAVLASVAFTPDVPGTWTLNVSFDGLGVRTVTVDVLPFFSERDGRAFMLPPTVDCPRGPWVLSNRTHALCEQVLDTTIAVFPLDGDGGVVTLPGQHLVVAQDVAWFLSGDGSQLQRYAWDGGLQLTDQWDNFNAVRVRGEHSRTMAIRAQSTNAVRVVETATSVDRAQSFFGSELTSSIFTFQPETMAIDAEPAGASGLQAIEPRVKWVRDFSVGTASSTLLMHRTAGTIGVGSGGIPIATPGLPRAAQLEPFERIPMWIPTSAGIVYLKQGISGLESSVWPANTVLVRATENFVVLQQADGGPNFYVVDR